MNFDSFFKNKKIIVTGHTGFKGSWLTLWLTEIGADVLAFQKMFLLNHPITNYLI